VSRKRLTHAAQSPDHRSRSIAPLGLASEGNPGKVELRHQVGDQPRVLIISNRGDEHLPPVLAQLENVGAEYLVVLPDAFGDDQALSMAFGPKKLAAAGLGLGDRNVHIEQFDPV
jgi:hypothetical protein